MNLVMVSSTLGGLVFASAAFIGKDKDSESRKLLMNVAKKFIIATFLCIIFFVFFTFIRDVSIDTSKLDFSKEGFVLDCSFRDIWWFSLFYFSSGESYFCLEDAEIIMAERLRGVSPLFLFFPLPKQNY